MQMKLFKLRPPIRVVTTPRLSQAICPSSLHQHRYHHQPFPSPSPSTFSTPYLTNSNLYTHHTFLARSSPPLHTGHGKEASRESSTPRHITSLTTLPPIRARISPASVAPEVLPAMETRKRATRRTSQSTSRRHKHSASDARRRRLSVPTPPPNCPLSTRLRDAS